MPKPVKPRVLPKRQSISVNVNVDADSLVQYTEANLQQLAVALKALESALAVKDNDGGDE